MTNKPIYDSSFIRELLPHQSPFLFVDRVMEIKTGEKIVAEKDLLPDEAFFAGHFPGRPLMPGVLVTEALAQTSGLLLGHGGILDRFDSAVVVAPVALAVLTLFGIIS